MRYSNNSNGTVTHKCPRCGRKTLFVNTGRFRVNANKNRLDVWLIFQCEKCRRTLNVPIYERVPVQKIPHSLYERFLDNDGKLAAAYGSDAAFLKSRGLR